MAYKRLPKKDQQIDKDTVRSLYLSGHNFHWNDFCAANNFNPKLRGNFPFKQWQSDWMLQKIAEQQELLAPKVLALREKIANGRVDVIGKQVECNAKLREIFSEMLDSFPRSTGNQALKFAMADELGKLVKINRCLQESEFQTLLITTKTANVNESLGPPPIESETEDEIPKIEITTVGSVRTSEESAALIASYFDQFEKRPEHTSGANDQ